MWLPLWMIKNGQVPKVSPKMVNPRDIVESAEEEYSGMAWQGKTGIDHQSSCSPGSTLPLGPPGNCLVGLVVKASASGAEDLGFKPRLWRDFSGSSHTSDLKIGTPVAILPGTWHYRVSAGTGWPGVSILWLGEIESLICSFYLSVAARKIVCAELSLRYTSMLLGR